MNMDDVDRHRRARVPPVPPRWMKIGLAALSRPLRADRHGLPGATGRVGVVLPLRPVRPNTEPGLHLKAPFIEDVLKVPVQRQLKLEFGFRTEEPGVRTRYSDEPSTEESVMLTGDLNVAVVEWIVQYRVTDPTSTCSRCGT